MNLSIAEWPLEEVEADTLPACALIAEECELDALPDFPPMGREEFVGFVAAKARTQRQWMMLATIDGEPAGYGALGHSKGDDNPTHAHFEIYVRPSCRRRGVATRLLDVVAQRAAVVDRTMLNTYAGNTTPGPNFLRAIGAEEKIVEHRNIAWLADIPEGLVESWIARAPERAQGYELLWLDAPCPDEWVERRCRAKDVMNTAPRDELDMEDEHDTPELLREREAGVLERGSKWWMVAAVETATGEIAGYSDVIVPTFDRDMVWQGDTGVIPAHRDRGLGRWLKAAMIERIRAELPEVNRIETWNAGSNEPMLAINHALGFRMLEEVGGWQVTLPTVQEWLATRSVACTFDGAARPGGPSQCRQVVVVHRPHRRGP